MAGGKSTPKKDKAVKVSSGMLVKTGQILTRGLPTYKAGSHVRGRDTLYALCPGKIFFSKKKTSKGRVRTYVHITPSFKT
jgi:ribosomal protein L27